MITEEEKEILKRYQFWKKSIDQETQSSTLANGVTCDGCGHPGCSNCGCGGNCGCGD